jgi:hypothetical protein
MESEMPPDLGTHPATTDSPKPFIGAQRRKRRGRPGSSQATDDRVRWLPIISVVSLPCLAPLLV